MSTAAVSRTTAAASSSAAPSAVPSAAAGAAPAKILVNAPPASVRPASATIPGSRTPRSLPQHQVSPQFQPRTSRSRVGSVGGPPHGGAPATAANGSPRTSRKTPPGSSKGLLQANSPRSPGAGPPRRRSGVPGSVDLFKRRHRRTLSDTPTSPFWSPSFEFLPSEDPEVELEDEKFVSSVKVDEIAPPSETDDKRREILRSISFPASLKAQHAHGRGSSYGGSVPVSPLGGGGAAVGLLPKSASPIRRRQSLKSPINKGRPVAYSPRAQALSRRSPGGVMQKRGSAVGAGLRRKHSVGTNSKSPPLLSPTSGAGAGSKVGYVPVSTQRAQRARRRVLPRRATTDLTPNRLPNAS